MINQNQHLQRHKQRNRISGRREAITQDRIKRAFENKLYPQLMKVFRQYGKEAASEYSLFETTRGSDERLASQFESVLYPHYSSVIATFATRVEKQILGKQEQTEFELLKQQFLAVYGAVAVTNITNTTLMWTKSAIILELEAGGTISSIAKKIYEINDGNIAKWRSRVIARTETANASSYASFERAKQLDLGDDIRGKWMTVGDHRTRESHQAVHGQTKKLGDNFKVNGYNMKRPLDGSQGAPASEIVNCRCVLLMVPEGTEVTS